MAEEGKEQAKVWAMMCHLLALAGWVFPLVGNIVGPLIVWAIQKDSSKFVDEQGKESLNFQITISLIGIIPLVLVFVVIGWPLLFLLGVFNTVMVIVASIKIANNEVFHYPFSLKLVK